MRRRFFVGEVVDYVLRVNKAKAYYDESLSELIPDEILDTEFTDKNTHELMIRIDEFRFEKEKQLAAMLPSGADLYRVINSKLNSLPVDQEQIRKEIKFLFNVGATLAHW